MDIKKTSTKDVYKSISQDYSGLYKKLQDTLGEKNPFAKFDIGAGMYIWSSSTGPWRQMTSASELKQEFVMEAFLKLKEEITPRVGSKTAVSLFTYPDDSYIYYNDENGEIRILLTGWGFKKPTVAVGERDEGVIGRKNPVNLSFSYDGVKLPNYEFGVRLAKQVKVLKTDMYGCYHFENLSVGENYVLIDIQSNRDYHLAIVEGQSDYDFDVTSFSTIQVRASYDGQPIVGENVHIDYHGKTYDCVTDSNGLAMQKVPFHNGDSVTAKLRNLTQSETIQQDNTVISFLLEKEKEPEVDVKVRVLEDGNPVESQAVSLSYSGRSLELYTNGHGECSSRFTYCQHDVCRASVPGYEPQEKILDAETGNLFLFEKVTEAKRAICPIIIIEDDKGQRCTDYPITVTLHGTSTDYTSDSNGQVCLPECFDGDDMTVTDGLHSSNVKNYTIHSDVENYYFYVQSDAEGERLIKVMVRDCDDKKIQCDYIRFQQDGAPEQQIPLDADGNAYFKQDSFSLGTPVKASFIGTARQFPEISFSLEKDEYEYLLKEKSKNTWLVILLEVLLILAAVGFLYLYWPFLMDFCDYIFHLLY